MGEIKIEFNSDGFRQLLESDGVRELVQSTADEICERANANVGGIETEGYKTTVMRGAYGGGRWIAHVQAADYAAAAAEAENKALTKAVK